MSDLFLRRIGAADVDALFALLCDPAVFEFLVDGHEPPREGVVAWVEKSDADFAAAGLGIWLLEESDARRAEPIGCVRLDLAAADRSAELTYLLAPSAWGRGLATRMAATAIDVAFDSGAVDRVWAGADGPNARSIAVMRRLGMRFWRDVVYPLGPGVEYALPIDAPRPSTRFPTIPLREAGA